MVGKRFVVGLGFAVIVAGVLPPGSPPDRDASMAATAAGESCYVFGRKDKQLFKLVNASRSNRDLPLYKLDPELSQVARKHTQRMIEQKMMFHDTATNSSRTTNWLAFGENVGRGAETVGAQHTGYMDSTVHRKNILASDFTHAGIAVKVAPWGELYTTELFTKTSNPGTTLPKPRC